MQEQSTINACKSSAWPRIYRTPAVDCTRTASQPFLTGFNSALGMRQRSATHFYVWEQVGLVWRIDISNGSRVMVLDKRRAIQQVHGGKFNFGRDERGLLGLAFDPLQADHVFVSYKRSPTHQPGKDHIARLSRFTIAHDGTDAEAFVDESKVLDIPEEEAFHHAQSLEFDEQGLLYYSVGDGGPQKDPHNHAQNLHELRGKILRLYLTRDGEAPYLIPATNPLGGEPSGRGEIIALGLRNPWRFSIEQGGRLFIADVGMDSHESIKILQLPEDPLAQLTLTNFGWSVYEGFEKKGFAPRLSVEPWTPPAYTYDTRHGKQRGAVAGGYLLGSGDRDRYLFADFVRASLSIIERRDGAGKWTLVEEKQAREWISTASDMSGVPAQRPVSPSFLQSHKFVPALSRGIDGQIYALIWAPATANADERAAIYVLKLTINKSFYSVAAKNERERT